MKSVGEAMSIGRSFNESLQKGFSSLEYGLYGLDKPQNVGELNSNIIEELKLQSSQRLLIVGEALRKGHTIEEIHNATKYDKWFLKQISDLVDLENLLSKNKLNKDIILLAKKNGFSDKKISALLNIQESEIRNFRDKNKINPVYRLVDTCAGEFKSKTPYLYSTYDWEFENKKFCESNPTNKNKVIILGGGPNRIGKNRV